MVTSEMKRIRRRRTRMKSVRAAHYHQITTSWLQYRSKSAGGCAGVDIWVRRFSARGASESRPVFFWRGSRNRREVTLAPPRDPDSPIMFRSLSPPTSLDYSSTHPDIRFLTLNTRGWLILFCSTTLQLHTFEHAPIYMNPQHRLTWIITDNMATTCDILQNDPANT